MTTTADANQKNFLRIQGIFLAIRCLVIAIVGIVAYDSDLPIFTVGLVGISIICFWLIRKHLVCRISYCFLVASALWAGISMAMLIHGTEPLAIAFGISLAILDGSIFASTWRREWL